MTGWLATLPQPSSRRRRVVAVPEACYCHEVGRGRYRLHAIRAWHHGTMSCPRASRSAVLIALERLPAWGDADHAMRGRYATASVPRAGQTALGVALRSEATT